MDQFHDQIRSLRLERGWSQGELARRAGTTQAVVSRIERGLHSPTLVMAQRLHGALGQQMVITSRALPAADALHLSEERQLSMQQRLERAFAWMNFNSRLHGTARG